MAHPQIDAALKVLQAHKRKWATLPLDRRIDYLDEMRSRVARLARPWVEAAVAAKGLSMDHPLAGEEWTSGPFPFLTVLNDLEVTLLRLSAGISPIEGYSTREATSGQLIVEVFPTTAEDRILFSGVSAEVWMDESVTPDRSRGHRCFLLQGS